MVVGRYSVEDTGESATLKLYRNTSTLFGVDPYPCETGRFFFSRFSCRGLADRKNAEEEGPLSLDFPAVSSRFADHIKIC